MITALQTVKGPHEIEVLHSSGGLIVHKYLGRVNGVDADGYTISHISGYMVIPFCESLEVAIATSSLLVAKFGDWAGFKGVYDEGCDRDAIEERRVFIHKLVDLLEDSEEGEDQ